MCVEISSSCLCRKYRISDIDFYFDILQRSLHFIFDVCFTWLIEEKERNTLYIKDKMIKALNHKDNITFLKDSIWLVGSIDFDVSVFIYIEIIQSNL